MSQEEERRIAPAPADGRPGAGPPSPGAQAPGSGGEVGLAQAPGPSQDPGVLRVDGAEGEGGGQLLRTALTLSMLTGRRLEFENIRAGRSRPGLMRQHLAGVRASLEVCGGEAEGAALGSTSLRFTPGPVRAGRYVVRIGSAGSTMLVLQTLLPALLFAEGESEVVLEGGTHADWAPSADFVDQVFLPCLRSMGARVDFELEEHGFYPSGGGRARCVVHPVRGGLRPLHVPERGARVSRVARALVRGLPEKIARRELKVCRSRLGWSRDELEVVDLPAGIGPGNAVLLTAEFEHATEMTAAYGRKGVTAEKVAEAACKEMREYLGSHASVGARLADQLLLPMALAGAGSFTTSRVTNHLRTQAWLLGRGLGLGAQIEIDEGGSGPVTVRVEAVAHSGP